MLSAKELLVPAFRVYDDSCNKVYEVIATNPCVSDGVLGCSPPPISINALSYNGNKCALDAFLIHRSFELTDGRS